MADNNLIIAIAVAFLLFYCYMPSNDKKEGSRNNEQKKVNIPPVKVQETADKVISSEDVEQTTTDRDTNVQENVKDGAQENVENDVQESVKDDVQRNEGDDEQQIEENDEQQNVKDDVQRNEGDDVQQNEIDDVQRNEIDNVQEEHCFSVDQDGNEEDLECPPMTIEEEMEIKRLPDDESDRLEPPPVVREEHVHPEL